MILSHVSLSCVLLWVVVTGRRRTGCGLAAIAPCGAVSAPCHVVRQPRLFWAISVPFRAVLAQCSRLYTHTRTFCSLCTEDFVENGPTLTGRRRLRGASPFGGLLLTACLCMCVCRCVCVHVCVQATRRLIPLADRVLVRRAAIETKVSIRAQPNITHTCRHGCAGTRVTPLQSHCTCVRFVVVWCAVVWYLL